MHDIVNFDYSFKDDGTFEIVFRPIERPILEWNHEVSETTKRIRNLTDKPIFLCMSGGVDSEIIAKEFIKNSIEFTGISLRHTEGTNDHDVSWAINFCKNNKIPHKVVDFDFADFVINKIPEYISQGYKSWRTFRFQQLYLFEIVESLGGTAVLGGGQSPFFTINGSVCWNWKSDELMCLDWLRKNDKVHFPYFYWQNSEIFASYLKQDLINHLISDPSYFLNHSLYSNVSVEKMLVCHKYWPDMPRRRKYDGFENITGTRLALDYIVPRRAANGELKELSMPVDIIKQQLKI